MSRLVKDRGSVGRRIWRRRKRRGPAAPMGTAAAEAGELDRDLVDGEADDAATFEEPDEEGPRPSGGMLAAVRALFSRRKQGVTPRSVAPSSEPSYLVIDPTRDVLSVPRGAARLDAFERALAETPAGTPQQRALALAYHRELSGLAEGAGVDLSLLEARVERCAQALIGAGEEERAGTLFLRVGKKHQAAELFLQVGAIDALEETHAQIHWDEGGARHQARLELERFEALWLVGARDQAFEALTRAHSLWPENPIYAEMHARFVERLGKPRRLRLRARDHERLILGTWPLVVGRGEEAALVLQSPMLSRAHVQVERKDGALVVRDLDSRGGTRVDGVTLVGTAPLRERAVIDMGGVVVETAPLEGGVLFWAALAPSARTVALTAERVLIAAPGAAPNATLIAGVGGLRVGFDVRGRAVVEPPAKLGGEAVRRATLLLEGDVVSDGAWSWNVARA
ncbi:MAG: FHA domain-containing protein [Deltaproteobacteria bacterium]|nr:FHA domain-containing protein [Deltaproteobacteria bacterium]